MTKFKEVASKCCGRFYPFNINELKYEFKKVLELLDIQAKKAGEEVIQQGLSLLKKAADSLVYRMKDREPVHDEKKLFGIKKGRKHYWKDIGLLTHHEPEPKQKILKQNNLSLGKFSSILIKSEDLSYYNNGARKNTFIKSEIKIND